MERICFDLNQTLGDFRAMNAVNNGPFHKRHANDQARSNLADYKAAKIPYARNHDAAFCNAYGGEHSVDISAIFPNFDADPYDEASYDFTCTDEYIAVTLLADTQTFYRLGQKIEHTVKKYNVYPPKDFQKWAVICEHIILHYNYGWANGFHYNIEYWEIWNEPDLDIDGTTVRTWGGTQAEFFDLYETAAKHLKSRFPELKIGGPALCCYVDWGIEFIAEMQKRNVPIDFFSWHIYTDRVAHVVERARAIKDALCKYGYENAESILNEWNYVFGWSGQEYVYSIEQIIGLKGAAFTLGVMCASQKSDIIDMLMYYDARPGVVFNGMFDFYTLRPFKGYYPFLWYGMFYGLKEVRSQSDPTDVYTLCGVDENGKSLTVVSYYAKDDDAQPKTVSLDFGRSGRYEVYYLDSTHDPKVAEPIDDLTFVLERNVSILVREL